MRELKRDLDMIFQQQKKIYKSLYNNGETFLNQTENSNYFNPVFKNLSDKLISKSNEYFDKHGIENKIEIKNHINELITEFQFSYA